MADKPSETKPPADEAADKAAKADSSAEKTDASPSAPGGFTAWLPLIVMIVLMPVLSFVMTRFVLAPRLARAISSGEQADAEPTPSATEQHPAAQKTTEAKGGENGKEKSANSKTEKVKGQAGQHVLAPLGKVLVNIAGSMGSRYLMANLTLVGNTPDLPGRVESNKDQLMDLASGVLYSKSISDLEQPGARNLIRNELRMVFNNALGEGVVQEIYITEFVIQ
jgi:flagellar protein FliL